MKKLTYVLNHYSIKDASHFTHILNLLEEIAAKKCDIVLLVEKADMLPSFKNKNIKAIRLWARLPLLRHLELFFRLIWLILHGYKTSFVRIAAPAAIVVSLAHRICGGRSYLWQSGTTHEYDFSQPRSIKKLHWWITSYLPNVIARILIHRFVTGPEFMVDYYSRVVGIPRRKIDLLYNDIQLERFQTENCAEDREIFRQKYNLPEDCLILLLVHRLSPVRRTLMYLEPFLKKIKIDLAQRHWVLVVAGGGSELANAKQLVSSLGVQGNVIFLGDVPNLEIPKLYAAGDIFVHPTYTEGFPRVLIEAMACGLPIVTTDAGGTSQLLGNKQKHYLVSKNDPEEFAARAIGLIRSQQSWAELGDENLRTVQRFSTDAVSDMYINVLFS